MLALITAALQGLAAIPRILEFFEKLNLEARLAQLEERQVKTIDAVSLLSKAQTEEERKSAIHALAASVNS